MLPEELASHRTYCHDRATTSVGQDHSIGNSHGNDRLVFERNLPERSTIDHTPGGERTISKGYGDDPISNDRLSTKKTRFRCLLPEEPASICADGIDGHFGGSVDDTSHHHRLARHRAICWNMPQKASIIRSQSGHHVITRGDVDNRLISHEEDVMIAGPQNGSAGWVVILAAQ